METRENKFPYRGWEGGMVGKTEGRTRSKREMNTVAPKSKVVKSIVDLVCLLLRGLPIFYVVQEVVSEGYSVLLLLLRILQTTTTTTIITTPTSEQLGPTYAQLAPSEGASLDEEGDMELCIGSAQDSFQYFTRQVGKPAIVFVSVNAIDLNLFKLIRLPVY